MVPFSKSNERLCGVTNTLLGVNLHAFKELWQNSRLSNQARRETFTYNQNLSSCIAGASDTAVNLYRSWDRYGLPAWHLARRLSFRISPVRESELCFNDIHDIPFCDSRESQWKQRGPRDNRIGQNLKMGRFHRVLAGIKNDVANHRSAIVQPTRL
jgi:hypothetical protein